MTKGACWIEDAFFCDECKPANAVELPDDLLIRRVNVLCHVFLAGVSIQAPLAEREALARIQQALEPLGAVIGTETVISTIGRYAPQPGAAAAIDAKGDPR